MSLGSRVIACLIGLSLLLQTALSDPPQCDSYIILMKDEYNTEVEMNNVRLAMEIMSPQPDGSSPLIRMTRELIPVIMGNLSFDAAVMASNMISVRSVECDQCVTRAEAFENAPISNPTEFPINFTFPSLELDEFSNTPPVSKTIGSANDKSTDRYGLDGLDENCFDCNDGSYIPRYTGKNVDVYILDTGIRSDHNDFFDPTLTRIRADYGGYDAIDDFQRESQRGKDCHGHGTHCAGVAVGRVSGVAKEANVYSVRVLNCQSFGGFSGIIRALDHVFTRHRARLALPIGEYKGSVVSMSLAGPVVQAANDAVCRLVRAGVVVVTASGNFRRDACNYSPGSAGCHINVGAHYYTERDTPTCILDVYWFSSTSTSPGNNYGRCVDILAPGQYVQSASYLARDRYVSMSGTSMACPHVAGAAALLLQESPRMSPARVKAILEADSCSEINERRMPSELRGLTPNRRLRVTRNRGEQITTTTTTTPTTTTTTFAPVPATPSPPECVLCAFDAARGSMIEEIEVVVREIQDPSFIRYGLYYELLNKLRYRQKIVTKVSITTIEGVGVLYTLIYRKIPKGQISDFRYILNNKNGIPYQDIDEEIHDLNQDCFPKTIIPIGDNLVYVLADCGSRCNDNEFRQANFTTVPEQIFDPFTIDNLNSETKATFDISIAPNNNQVYVSNTVKNNPACECFNYYNIEKSDLTTFSETIGSGRKLVVQDIEAVYYQSKLSFTVTLCIPDCYTGTSCVNEVLNNPVFIDLTEERMQSMIISLRRLEWEPIAVVGYQDEGIKHAISFIRVR